jgi:hypothetical protein
LIKFDIGELQSRLALVGAESENRGEQLPGVLIVAQASLDPSRVDLVLRIRRVPLREAVENSTRLEWMIGAEKSIPQTLERIGVIGRF